MQQCLPIKFMNQDFYFHPAPISPSIASEQNVLSSLSLQTLYSREGPIKLLFSSITGKFGPRIAVN